MDGSQPIADADIPCPHDSRAERRERDLQTLAQLNDICMDVAGMVREMVALDLQNARAAAAGDKPRAAPVLQGDIGLILPRIAKAVRLTMALGDKIAEGKLAVELERAAERAAKRKAIEEAPYRAHQALVSERRGKIDDLIEAVIDDEVGSDKKLKDEYTDHAYELLLEDEDYQDCLNHPIGPMVARVFETMDIHPDWGRWARQAWAREEAEENTPGSPYATSGPSP